jgi:uncharacterized protein YegP (UPF0339 family)
MNYDVYLGADGYWWWRLFGDNGRVLAHAAQGRATPALCRSEIETVKASAAAPVGESQVYVDASVVGGR